MSLVGSRKIYSCEDPLAPINCFHCVGKENCNNYRYAEGSEYVYFNEGGDIMTQRTFFIGCTHFGHDDIIKYENRPFKSVEEMDNTMIENWNKTVRINDVIIVAGDFCFCDKKRATEILSQLNGYKILVMGNHDREKNNEWFLEVGFNEVINYPICVDGFFWVSHEPMYLNNNMPYVNIHAHIHSKKYDNKHYINVCVECINYTPIEFHAIKGMFKGEI